MRRRLLTVCLLLVAAAPVLADDGAPFWGQTGHRVIARVAAGRLSPEARRTVQQLIPGESLASVATWADSIRPHRPATAPWHYVNIPVWDSIYRPAAVCPTGNCIVAALEKQLMILADRQQSRSARADALKWVVHLVGDLHQPLHVGDRGDRGGNDVKLTWDGRTSNLHSVWDSGLLAGTGTSEEQLVVQVTRTLQRRGDLARLTSGSIIDWAIESHDVARDVVYPFLPASLALDQGYLDKVQLALTDRVVRASARLAALLERALAKG